MRLGIFCLLLVACSSDGADGTILGGGSPSQNGIGEPAPTGPQGTPPSPGLDASTGGGTDAGVAGDAAHAAPQDAAVHDGAAADAGHAAGDAGCINAVPSPGSGHHNAGQDCMSCHANLSASIRWTVAGTLYSAATGGSAISGATVVVVDKNGQTLQLPTYSNGNFYTTTAVAFPLTVRATQCPSNAPMTSTVTDGSCNSCHNSSMRIHLP